MPPDSEAPEANSTIRVSKTTDPDRLAALICRRLLRNEACEIAAIGPEAISRAATAIAIAGGLLFSRAYAVSCRVYLAPFRARDGKAPVRALRFRLSTSPIP